MKSKELIDEILDYHRKKGKKDNPKKLGMFDYHHKERTTEAIPCDDKCGKLLEQLENEKLKEILREA